jgi:trehalose 6-phosphate synthase
VTPSETTHDFVVVANRLPVAASTDDDGTTTWSRSPGGLVSALEPTLRGVDAVWVGWSGRNAPDPYASEDWGLRLDPVPEGIGPCALDEVELTLDEVDGFYEGFSNSALWPLYHDGIATPSFHRHHWEPYREVNRKFADRVAVLAAEGATVWVHDYQLQLVPRLLRERRPDLTIGFFNHIPFPPPELFRQLPWRDEVLAGLLGADLVGMQTEGDSANLLEAAAGLLGLAVDGDAVEVPDVLRTSGSRRSVVRTFPISIDSGEYDAIARTAEVVDAAAGIRATLGNPKHVLLGVDRLDYTKGIDVRLTAFSELLAEGELPIGDTVFVQIATPSRENVDDYKRARDDIELIIGRAIGENGLIGAPPIQYVHQPLDRESLVAFYLAADVMIVTPYRDGMNLVCKEFVASRHNGDGALVLSEFAGAANELVDAFLVNPFDADGMKSAMLDAVRADDADLRRRMKTMRAQVFEHDGARWANDFLSALDATRRPA